MGSWALQNVVEWCREDLLQGSHTGFYETGKDPGGLSSGHLPPFLGCC